MQPSVKPAETDTAGILLYVYTLKFFKIQREKYKMKMLIIAGLSAILLGACSSSTVTSSWKQQNANTMGLKKVMVVAMAPDKDRAMVSKMEQQLASDLQSQGIPAVAASDEFGPKALIGMKEKAVLNRLNRNGIDGVVTISLLDKTKERNYVPGNISYQPVTFYSRFYRGFVTYYDRYQTPGYYDTNTKFVFETNLYDLNKDKLLYSAQSESFDEATINRMATDYGKEIVKDMKKGGLIQ